MKNAMVQKTIWLAAVLVFTTVGAPRATGQATPGETYTIRDAAADRAFELATDEIHVLPAGRRGGRGQVLKIPPQRDRRAMKQYARDMRRQTGKRVQLVLYEAGRPRNEWSRRLVTSGVTVKLDPGADIDAITASVNGYCRGRLTFAHDYAVIHIRDGNALDAAEVLRQQPGVVSADALLAKKRAKRLVPNDTYFGEQWHLQNTGQNTGAVVGVDMKCVPAWDLATGTGVVIGIVDDGLEIGHEDLAANVDLTLSYDFNEMDNDPSPDPFYDWHGTPCAGLAAARGNNALGVSGSAPEASLAGLRILAGNATDLVEAEGMAYRNDVIAIKSNSWGPDDFYAGTLDGPGPLLEQAFQHGVTHGRNGLGNIFLWAAGNGGPTEWQSANTDGYANSIYTIAVGALNDTGLSPDYSEVGACLVVSAPAGEFGVRPNLTTTDLTGRDGYNDDGFYTGDPPEVPDYNYTRSFGGTSAATPLVAGVAALMLEQNPALGWRDVQEILMRSATKNNSSDPGWVDNAAGIHFHHAHGAGLVNALAAVQMASNWPALGPQVTLNHSEAGLSIPIPDNDTNGVSRSYLQTPDIRLEHVTLTFEIDHTDRGDLEIEVIAPSGTRSVMMDRRTNDDEADYDNWRTMSVRHWGESAAGTWTVKVMDAKAGDTGTLKGLDLRFYGTVVNNPPVVTITTPNTQVPGATNTYDISGTANSNVVGSLSWSNALNGASGTIPAAASWTITGIALAEGPNQIWVSGENADGIPSRPGVSITRQEMSTGLWFQGFEPTNDLVWAQEDTWPIAPGDDGVSQWDGLFDIPEFQAVRSHFGSWQTWLPGTQIAVLELAEVSVTNIPGDMILTAHASATTYEDDLNFLVGMIDSAYLSFYVALDGANFSNTPDIKINGRGTGGADLTGVLWGFDATGVAETTAGTPLEFQPAGEGIRTTDGYATVRIRIPAGTSTVKLKVRARNLVYEPSWNIDDISLRGLDRQARITDMFVNGGDVHIEWQDGAEVTQHVEYVEDLVTTGLTWHVLFTAPPSTPQVTNAVHTAPSDDTLIYRMRAQP